MQRKCSSSGRWMGAWGGGGLSGGCWVCVGVGVGLSAEHNALVSSVVAIHRLHSTHPSPGNFASMDRTLAHFLPPQPGPFTASRRLQSLQTLLPSPSSVSLQRRQPRPFQPPSNLWRPSSCSPFLWCLDRKPDPLSSWTRNRSWQWRSEKTSRISLLGFDESVPGS